MNEVDLPHALAEAVEAALAAMRSDPRHQLNWRYRQTIYEAFGPQGESVADLARGWLAIWAAEHVLPIFYNMFVETQLEEVEPQRFEDVVAYRGDLDYWLELAKGVIVGNIHPAYASGVSADDHTALGCLWMDIERMGVEAVNKSLSATAVHCALMEAAGLDPFEYIDRYAYNRRGFISVAFGFAFDDDSIPATELDDEVLATVYCDAAAAAAVAYSCTRMSTRCNPKKLRDFWEWWLGEAIPQAWQTAQLAMFAEKTKHQNL